MSLTRPEGVPPSLPEHRCVLAIFFIDITFLFKTRSDCEERAPALSGVLGLRSGPGVLN